VRFADQVEAGMTHVNDLPAVDLANMPFGGEKNSGLGRFGANGMLEDDRALDLGAARYASVSFLTTAISRQSTGLA
jgi:hypothetical protein